MTQPNHRNYRSWNNYINHNSLGMMDCQVVTAVNAYYFLTGKIIKQDSKRYNSLIKLARAQCGSAISIENVWKHLGIKVVCLSLSPVIFYANKQGNQRMKFSGRLPLEIGVWHKNCGNHSALIVDYEPITDSYRIANFPWVTSKNGWMHTEDLEHYLRTNVDKKEPRWKFRKFELSR
jgi:hypothetical protein